MEAKEFKSALDELGISQHRLARMVDMDIASINRWANDRAQIPGIAAAYIRLLLAIHHAAFGLGKVAPQSVKRIKARPSDMEAHA